MTTQTEVRPKIDEEFLLFKHTSGPRNARVLLVGEAWGAGEAAARAPFQGASGQELNRMLREAGLSRESILCTNLISEQPPNNDFTYFLISNKEAKGLGGDYHGVYPKPALATSISKLWKLVDHVNPDLIVAAGNWPLHILTPHATIATKAGYKLPSGIGSWRGSQTKTRPSPANRTYNLLPIIHPAAILREWSFRNVTVHDLRSRAGRFLSGSLKWEAPPALDIFMPTMAYVERLLNLWIARALHRSEGEARPEFLLSVDIETYKRRFISCIGLADDEAALCIPFFYFDSSQRCVDYWSKDEELYIWKRIRYLLSLEGVSIVGQNFMYDTIFLERYYSVNAHVSYDAGLMHHLLYPGTPKTLPRLASLYNHYYCYWKDESEDWNADETKAQDLWRYNCKDLRATLESVRLLRKLHAKRGVEELYRWRIREWKLAREMALRGIRYDEKRRREFAENLYRQIEPLQQFLLRAVPESARFAKSGKPWFDSNTATMDLFYNRIGVGKILHKKTGNATFDDSAINALIEDRKNRWLLPLLERLSAYRSAQVFNRNFIKVRLSPDGRLRTQFKIDTPETFRWSSAANPFEEGGNLQNLPKVEVD